MAERRRSRCRQRRVAAGQCGMQRRGRRRLSFRRQPWTPCGTQGEVERIWQVLCHPGQVDIGATVMDMQGKEWSKLSLHSMSKISVKTVIA